ncbi:hypothetical protein BCV70DRAFT_197470 [Testicularia cyperi]|uniref:Uncharacterized protein n=1 Tax=Testicularia cyperi TaxID=1882483 RepID=A0A317XZM0_9BASI|nr:hypothetical protein BCV70DRAFT_197470 [Testicularia cyperi]
MRIHHLFAFCAFIFPWVAWALPDTLLMNGNPVIIKSIADLRSLDAQTHGSEDAKAVYESLRSMWKHREAGESSSISSRTYKDYVDLLSQSIVYDDGVRPVLQNVKHPGRFFSGDQVLFAIPGRNNALYLGFYEGPWFRKSLAAVYRVADVASMKLVGAFKAPEVWKQWSTEIFPRYEPLYTLSDDGYHLQGYRKIDASPIQG